MLALGLGLGSLLIALGAVTYYLAPRIGPNPIFGVRVGYSYANRDVWDRTNRFGGMLIALTGLGVAALAMVLELANLPADSGRTLLIGAMIIALLAEVGWMFLYARRLSQGSAVADISPVPFRWSYLAPVLLTFALLLALAVYLYPSLPAGRMATHFNFADQPDGWMTRDAFYVSFVGVGALVAAFDILVVLVATREPLIAFGRWGTGWRLDPDRGLIYIAAGFAALNLILMAVLWDVAWFNLHGVHAFPLSALLWLMIPFIALLVGLFFALGRRERQLR